MKAVFISIFNLLVVCCMAQTYGLNNALKLLLEEHKNSGLNCDILVKGNMQELKQMQPVYQYKVNYSAGDIASVYINIKQIPLLLEKKIIRFAEYIPATKQLLNDTMIYRNRIKSVKLWTAPLPQAYNGEGVLMGIVDSGIDFSHPDFKDAQGKSRIQYLWEQSPVNGSSVPQPFNYGIEWTQSQIDNNQCTHNDVASFGHGTHVSGIAAGNAKANGRFEGIASESDLIVVALDFNRPGPTIADAINYIFTKVNVMAKPCVINLSLGDYYGSHDGTDLETQLIENLVKNKPGKVLVAAVGNAGSVKFHVKTQPLNNDTLFTWLQSGGAINYHCYADTLQIKNLTMRVGANRSNYSNAGAGNFKNYNYALSAIQTDTIKNQANQRLGLVKTVASINSFGVYELNYQIFPDTAGLLWRVETTGSGLHHAWNFNFVSTGLPSVAQFPKITQYAQPDSMYSMVSGFQNSEEVITVANYCNIYSYYDVLDTLHPSGLVAGQIAASSSCGPTRDGRIKPDISATGQGVFSAMALGMQNNLITNAPSVVAQGSMHVVGGGSSAASPVVAGLAALYLQRFPTASNLQVKAAIRNCAYFDAYTGTNLPDYRWGYGKLDGKAAMNCGLGVYNSLTERFGVNAKAYPNPFGETVTLEFESESERTIAVFNSIGQTLYQYRFSGSRFQLDADVLPENYSGLLFITIYNGTENQTIKLIRRP